jgi:hypothetical protein
MQSAQSHAAQVIPEQRHFAKNDANEDIPLLLAGLLEEILNSALLTAATASIANWMLAKKDGTNRSNLTCYLPPIPAFFQQSLLKVCVHIDLFSVSSRLREYYDRLELLRSLTLRFAAHCEEPGAHDPVGIEVLSCAWQELAGACRAAVSELGEQLGEDGAMRNNERYHKVLEVLSEIELGYHPCVSADGVVTVPFWLERRALRRQQMNLQAYIVVGESIEKVAVLNASDKGIGVLGLANANTGTKVHLLVRPGFSIDGKVVWVKDGRAGIALEQPLPADSSLFALIN